MPPESLSTLAVMNPGPRTARNSMIRIRQRFHIGADSCWRLVYIVSFLTIAGRGLGTKRGGGNAANRRRKKVDKG